MRPSRSVIAMVLGLVGLVWIAQGVGIIGGSVMSGSAFWAVVGVPLVVLAAGILIRQRRPSGR